MCYGETLSAAIVRARKQHGCDDCGRTIQPGRAYYRHVAKDARDLMQTKLCRTCYLALDDAQGPGECHWFGSGDSRDALRSEPWRKILAEVRAENYGVWNAGDHGLTAELREDIDGALAPKETA